MSIYGLSSISTSGSVTVDIIKNSKVIGTVSKHNAASDLFNAFLRDSILGIYTIDRQPEFLGICNEKSGSLVNASGGLISCVKRYSIGATTACLEFVIPSQRLSVAGKIKGFRLYGPDLNNHYAEMVLDTELLIPAESSLRVTWKIAVNPSDTGNASSMLGGNE